MKVFGFGLILAVFLFLSLGCGTDADPEEDYKYYDEVFSGDGPREEFQDLVIKLRFEDKSVLNGEMEGPFYAKIRGTYLEGPTSIHIRLESFFAENGCEGQTQVELAGELAGNELSARIQYEGCNVYDFVYVGERIGGSGRD